MKHLISFIALILLIAPKPVLADIQSCSPDGYTIATINGIFTNEQQAQQNKESLKQFFKDKYDNEPLKIEYFHNPSHLAGIGDVAMSVYQKFFENEKVEDYDLVEMLKTASEKVNTQKLLLVAHSQGNFYANSFYDSVAGQKGGVPEESINIYGVATPAGRVAGDGKWLTSKTDKVIAGVVDKFPFRNIMEPNTNITLGKDDDFFGHNFTEVYLKYRGDKIISDIQDSLRNLKVNNENIDGPCIKAPEQTLAHVIQGLALAIADPIAATSTSVVKNVIAGFVETGTKLANIAGSLLGNISTANLENITADTVQPEEQSLTPESYSEEAFALPVPQNPEDYQIPKDETAANIKNQLAAIEKRINEIKSQETGNTAAIPAVQPQNSPVVKTVAPVTVPKKVSLTSPPVSPVSPPTSSPSATASQSFTPPPPPVPPATVSGVVPQSSPVDQEILISLSGSGLDNAPYDIKISIESEGILSDIYSNDAWESSNFYLPGAIAGPTFSAKQFRLKIKDDKQSFRGNADIFVKIRKSGTTTGQFMFSGNINIQDSLILPPPPTPPPSPTPPPAPSPEPVPPPVPPTPTTPEQIANADHIVISEVQITGGTGHTTDDFIEIYNPTDSPVNLKGYRLVKRTATGGSDSLIKSWTTDALIAAHGFYLWADGNYSAISVTPDVTTSSSIAADNAIAIRLGANDTGDIIDAVGWGNASNALIETSPFSTNPGANESLVRKNIQSDSCFCDTDNNANDFEINTTPNPQNSSVVLGVIDQDFVTYDKNHMALNFAWEEPFGTQTMPSGLTYKIIDKSDASQKLDDISTASETAAASITEIGRDYKFALHALYGDGLDIEIAEDTISIPGFLADFSFYPDPRASGNYLIEGSYDSSFIPDLYDHPNTWKAMIFYLNSEASLESQGLIDPTTNWQPTNTAKVQRVKYYRCSGPTSESFSLIFPEASELCADGGLRGLGLKTSELEDNHFLVSAIHEGADSFSSEDYITVAYYSIYDNQTFKLAASDSKKYYFKGTAPQHNAPNPPQNITLSSYTTDSLTSELSLNWDRSVDSDTPDYSIKYEYSLDGGNYTPLSLGGGPEYPSKMYSLIYLPLGATYELSIRAVDDFGLTSSPSIITIVLPPSQINLTPDSSNPYFAIDEAKIENNLLKIKWRLISNPSSTKTSAIIPYEVSAGVRNQSKALNKIPEGNFSYPQTTIGGPSCNSEMTQFSAYVPGFQYENTFSTLGIIPVTTGLIGQTLQFNLYLGSPCAISIDDAPAFSGYPVIIQ